jgi:patatin-like phospholipase/acyl hydrolase
MIEPILQSPAAEAHNGRFQILALDGGGIRGLFSAAVLAALEEDCGVEVTRSFDLIAGTSTGGVIALALGIGLRPKEIVDFYLNEGPKIFGGSRWWRALRHPLRHKHDQEPLKAALQEVFGERTLADSQKRLVVPAFSIDSNDVYLFKTPHHERLRRDWRVPVWQVALATSAAPTYFPASRHTGDVRLVDGGVWANNPSVVGVAEAVSMLGVPLSVIKVFNLGTTTPVKNRPDKLTNGGRLAWLSQATDVILAAQSCGTYGLAGHLIGVENISRLDPAVPDGLFQLDRLDAVRLNSLAHEHSRKFAPEYLSRFGCHKAAPYSPLYTHQEVAA